MIERSFDDHRTPFYRALQNGIPIGRLGRASSSAERTSSVSRREFGNCEKFFAFVKQKRVQWTLFIIAPCSLSQLVSADIWSWSPCLAAAMHYVSDKFHCLFINSPLRLFAPVRSVLSIVMRSISPPVLPAAAHFSAMHCSSSRCNSFHSLPSLISRSSPAHLTLIWSAFLPHPS